MIVKINNIDFEIEYDFADDTGPTWYAWSVNHTHDFKFFGNGHDNDLIREDIEEQLYELEQAEYQEDGDYSNLPDDLRYLHKKSKNELD